jgi:hypothetical protein
VAGVSEHGNKPLDSIRGQIAWPDEQLLISQKHTGPWSCMKFIDIVYNA